MIDAKQLRAARALLDWKTSDLSIKTAELAKQMPEFGKKTSITVNAINKIERGTVHGRRDTMETLQKVFEDAGIEFLPNSGLRLKDRVILTFEGDGAQQSLLDDVYQTLAKTGGEVLIAHVDEEIAISNLSEEFLSKHIERLNAANITERMLIRVGDNTVVTNQDSYRMIPEEFFIPTPMFIYGDKLALLSWKPSIRVAILNDARFAESARRLFNFAWENAQRLPSSKKGR